MCASSSLYVPSGVERVDPEKLSGLLLIVGKSFWDIDFFQYISLDRRRLEDVVQTFPEPLRSDGGQMIGNSLRNAHQNRDPKLILIAGHANNNYVYLNPEIKGVDKYPLGIYSFDVYGWHAFLLDCLEVALGYFLEYDPSLEQQQKPL